MDAKIIETLVKDGYIPVLATVASSPTGESLNVNADIAAGEVCTSRRNGQTPLVRFSIVLAV